MFRRCVICLVPLALLAACGSEKQAPKPEDDPAMSAALHDRIMVDPDLVGQNRANAAAVLPDGTGAIPVEDSSPEAIAAARSDALSSLADRGDEKGAGCAGSVRLAATRRHADRGGARRRHRPAVAENCARRRPTPPSWAAKMPEAFPVYPRGAVQEAAGTDEGNMQVAGGQLRSPRCRSTK